MKNHALQFSVVRFQPDLQRQETANIGIVLFGPEGPQVRVTGNLTKLLALDPNLSLQRIHEDAARLQEALTHLFVQGMLASDAASMFGSARSGLTLSPVGQIDKTGCALEQLADELERSLVLAPTKLRVREKRTSRLHTELRSIFKQAKILGRGPDDIAKHLVVPNFPIDPDLGLFAEFALRNGKLHVTETVDFRSQDVSAKKREAESKTLLLLQAIDRVGRADLKRYVVVCGIDDKRLQPSMNLLSRHADDFVVRESQEDWSRYVNAMHAAALADRPAVDGVH